MRHRCDQNTAVAKRQAQFGIWNLLLASLSVRVSLTPQRPSSTVACIHLTKLNSCSVQVFTVLNFASRYNLWLVVAPPPRALDLTSSSRRARGAKTFKCRCFHEGGWPLCTDTIAYDIWQARITASSALPTTSPCHVPSICLRMANLPSFQPCTIKYNFCLPPSC